MIRPFAKRLPLAVAASFLLVAAGSAFATNYPITPQQRATAQQVAQAGVPLEDLAPNAPDSYTVKRGDTLWDISKLYLKSPWRWPQLWGMNLEQIRNPHLIYPGQMLVLDKSGGRARLRVAQPGEGTTTDKLSPRVRSEPAGDTAIASIPLSLIGPFLTDGTVLSSNELDAAPRVVAAPEGRVLMGKGDRAYVRGELGGVRDWRIFRQAVPLRDPTTQQILGYEARFVGNAAFVREGGTAAADGQPSLPVPATFELQTLKEEVGVGDRLAPIPASDYANFVPHAPAKPLAGQVVQVYGDGLIAGQHQVVSINRGNADGLERGHVLAVLRDGMRAVDTTGSRPEPIKLPDERHGLMMVFRVFDRVSYALVLQVQQPVQAGDRFAQP
ncbi:MAG TPA: LysM peptidoglycan-binding domain-containing protein [Burkholderiaceae bacterium]|nr:LysM peptidoglycan-binding domain-containing protein [Burkholderiaceae bacterium]